MEAEEVADEQDEHGGDAAEDSMEQIDMALSPARAGAEQLHAAARDNYVHSPAAGRARAATAASADADEVEEEEGI